MTARILVVDDEERLRDSIVEILESWGYSCAVAADGEAALGLVAGGGFDLALVDVRMPLIGGLDLLRRTRALAPDLAVAMMTGFPSVESAVVAMKYGAIDFYTKPLDLARLKEDLSRLFAARTGQGAAGCRSEVAAPLRGKLEGESAAMCELRASVERVAPTDAPVIVSGESGTGKELVAEALHALSRRSRAAMLKLNCAAIPDGLLESELFGHERGAFTGAETRKAGLLERADGGTVFLDEIGDMDLRLQAKLLRVLQDGEFRRLGGSESLRCDVRLLAATNRDLPELIAAGRFREDLYYRLSVIQLKAPALRERTGDIPILAQRFADDFAFRYGKQAPRLGSGLLALLMAQPWPGNVRELKNCIERAVIFCDGGSIEVEHLPPQYRESRLVPPPSGAGIRRSYGSAMDALDRSLVIDALEKAGGNRTKAAELLGIHRRTLYYKLERLGIDPDGPPRAP
jgi:DNA-binding NtrC family response regulator